MARQRQCIALDAEAVKWLRIMAQMHEGNLSMTMRSLIRSEAQRRGLVYEAVNGERR
jgi:hypothetical protein